MIQVTSYDCNCGYHADGPMVTQQMNEHMKVCPLRQLHPPRPEAVALAEQLVRMYDEGDENFHSNNAVSAFAALIDAAWPADGIRFDAETGTYVARHTILTAGRTEADAKAALASAIGLTAAHWPMADLLTAPPAPTPAREIAERLTDDEQRELDRLLAQVCLPTFTEREREITAHVARAALAALPPVSRAAGWQCGRGHTTRQPKCPACHDLVAKINEWLGYGTTSVPPDPPVPSEAKENA